MILISIDPFAFKKTFLLAVALLGLSSALCLADPVFISSQFGSRDRQSHGAASVAFSARARFQPVFSEDAQDAAFDSAANWLACNSQ